MTTFKGEGTVSTVMGLVKAEFVNGEIKTEDSELISFLVGKGYKPEETPVVKTKTVKE